MNSSGQCRVIGLILLLILQSSARAELVIDDFEVGFIPFGSDSSHETDLNTAHVLSGNRRLGTFGGDISAELSPDEPNVLVDAIHFSNVSTGFATLAYDPVAPQTVDLTQGGTLDRLELRFADAPASVRGRIHIQVRTPSGIALTVPPLGPEVLEIPFSDFNTAGHVDFSRVYALNFGLEFIASSGTYSLASIKAVPEPASLSCLIVGASCLLVSRRRLNR